MSEDTQGVWTGRLRKPRRRRRDDIPDRIQVSSQQTQDLHAALVGLGPSPASVDQALAGYETPMVTPAASGHSTPLASAVDPAEVAGEQLEAKAAKLYEVQCDLCNTWREVCFEDKFYFSGPDMPFCCASVGLECAVPVADEEAEEPVVGPAVATCCPQAAQGPHRLDCPEGRRLLEEVARREAAAKGRGRRTRGGRGKGQGKGRPTPSTEPSTPAASSQQHQLTTATWTQLDGVVLADVFTERTGTLQNVPRAFRGRFRTALLCTLEKVLEAEEANNEPLKSRAWKLWCLLPTLFLKKPRGSNKEGRQELQARFDLFWRGQWLELLARTTVAQRQQPRGEDTLEKRMQAAEQKVRLGEASQAAQILTAGKLAPGSPATLEELRKRRATPEEALPEEVRNFAPEAPAKLEAKLFLSVLRAAPKGSSASLTGWRYEHLKVALDQERVAEALQQVATLYAQARLPEEAAELICKGTLTALLKANGKVRGIVAGDALRRLVARTLSKEYGSEMELACAPHQYALSTRAGTECVTHLLRAELEDHPENTVLSLDGIGEYDTIRRKAMLEKLRTLPRASVMLPFVLMSYGGRPNTSDLTTHAKLS